MADICPEDYPEFLREIAEIIDATLVDGGIDRQTARTLSWTATERLRDDCGGQTFYIPKGGSYRVGLMREEIFRRWDGRNTRQLCRELGISERRLLQLAAEARKKSTDA